MMERHDHNNPWADKLQDIRVPEVNDAWKAMEVLLDEEMPQRAARDRRRWLLLIILLLLLIGVCNCPGRLRRDMGNGSVAERQVNKEDGKRTETAPAPGGSDGGNIRGVDRTDTVFMTGRAEHAQLRMQGKFADSSVDRTERRVKGKRSQMVKKEHKGKGGRLKDSIGGERLAETEDDNAGRQAGDTVVRVNKAQDTIPAGKAAVKKQPARKSADSVAAGKKPDSTSPDLKGWMAGIGLNQFFTVGGQQRSNYNSGGTTGGLSDYIPVPMIRYYFSRKLFVQLEAQFNTPQYMKKDLLASQSPVDTTNPGQRLQSVLYIKKLFYFNLPLSVHYSPFPNFYVGTGLQFSRLTNGVGLFQDRSLASAGGDTIKSSKVQSFKNDTTYQKMKTHEFRLLFDLSYTYKKFIIGARYNRALNNFLDVRISDTQVTQSRNSSIQVYLRYILWDGRKKRSFTK